MLPTDKGSRRPIEYSHIGVVVRIKVIYMEW
jgi:hypothetical protein